MSLETVRVSGTSTSDLTLTSVTVVDSGEYSCHSDVVIAASVQIYITSGKLKTSTAKCLGLRKLSMLSYGGGGCGGMAVA